MTIKALLMIPRKLELGGPSRLSLMPKKRYFQGKIGVRDGLQISLLILNEFR